jgi:hypothetical protein
VSFQIVYYTFSAVTLFVAVLNLWNSVSLKLSSRNALGKVIKKGMPEYKDMQKAISRIYIRISAGVLLLSLFNLLMSVREIFKLYDTKHGAIILVIYSFTVITGMAGILLVLRSIYGKSSDKGSRLKHRSNDDWRL